MLIAIIQKSCLPLWCSNLLWLCTPFRRRHSSQIGWAGGICKRGMQAEQRLTSCDHSMLAAQVILRVPMEYCLLVDYEGNGLSLPNFAWPRLREAVQQNSELPWDVLLVRCLLNHMNLLSRAAYMKDSAYPLANMGPKLFLKFSQQDWAGRPGRSGCKLLCYRRSPPPYCWAALSPHPCTITFHEA